MSLFGGDSVPVHGLAVIQGNTAPVMAAIAVQFASLYAVNASPLEPAGPNRCKAPVFPDAACTTYCGRR